MELYVLGSESDTSGRGGSADGRLGCQQQQLVHPVVTSSLCELHSAEGLPTGFRPTKGCAVIAEQNRLSLLCACMRACFFFLQHFTSKQTIACVAFESTSQYRLVFTQSKTTPPKTTPPVLMAANHRANQHATKKTQVIVGDVPPRPPRTWQTNTAVTPLTLLPNADLILPVGRVVLIAGAAAAMNIHTALPFWAGGPGC